MSDTSKSEAAYHSVVQYARERGLTLSRPGPHHWQVVRGDTPLVDVWPSTGRYRPANAPKGVKASHGGWDAVHKWLVESERPAEPQPAPAANGDLAMKMVAALASSTAQAVGAVIAPYLERVSRLTAMIEGLYAPATQIGSEPAAKPDLPPEFRSGTVEKSDLETAEIRQPEPDAGPSYATGEEPRLGDLVETEESRRSRVIYVSEGKSFVALSGRLGAFSTRGLKLITREEPATGLEGVEDDEWEQSQVDAAKQPEPDTCPGCGAEIGAAHVKCPAGSGIYYGVDSEGNVYARMRRDDDEPTAIEASETKIENCQASHDCACVECPAYPEIDPATIFLVALHGMLSNPQTFDRDCGIVEIINTAHKITKRAMKEIESL